MYTVHWKLFSQLAVKQWKLTYFWDMQPKKSFGTLNLRLVKGLYALKFSHFHYCAPPTLNTHTHKNKHIFAHFIHLRYRCSVWNKSAKLVNAYNKLSNSWKLMNWTSGVKPTGIEHAALPTEIMSVHYRIPDSSASRVSRFECVINSIIVDLEPLFQNKLTCKAREVNVCMVTGTLIPASRQNWITVLGCEPLLAPQARHLGVMEAWLGWLVECWWWFQTPLNFMIFHGCKCLLCVL